MSSVGLHSITERSMSLCIPIPTMNCAITATVRFGSGEAINSIYERSAAKGRFRRIAYLTYLSARERSARQIQTGQKRKFDNLAQSI